ncbi:cytosolic sulfotransferase 2-like isoform X3 [Sphaeramia orbicularis]|uniref:cytosolic sulfotransferase 2-like isoform X3 n=1 Tax=Sphaeramia orbicularis TaxID=375764 RepID=UPI00117E8F86|nr:cytosolic sulfotransferase 2-like isoform X3 [Sphaeramia orbicularis]
MCFLLIGLSRRQWSLFTDSQMETLPRPELFYFHGVGMTKYFTENWENTQNFKARPDDILIATYPKAGTDQADHLPTSPRLIKTHLPVQFVPKSFWEQNCKVVYVARNAKDNAVSYFHFGRMNNAQPEPGDWNTFLQNFMDGKMVFGPWYDHVNNWWKKKQTYSNIHYMFYEDLIEDPGKEIDRLCSFVGCSPSAGEKKKVLEGTSFDKMKENKMTNYTTVPVMDHAVSPFMRKGKVGDWKTHFTVAQSEHFNEDYKQKMKDSTLQFHTEVQKSLDNRSYRF